LFTWMVSAHDLLISPVAAGLRYASDLDYHKV